VSRVSWSAPKQQQQQQIQQQQDEKKKTRKGESIKKKDDKTPLLDIKVKNVSWSTPTKGKESDIALSTSVSSSKAAFTRDAKTIEKDVARSTWHLLGDTNEERRFKVEHKADAYIARIITQKQQRLANLIHWTLDKETLHYYQGFHEVASVVLSTLAPPERAFFASTGAFASADTLRLPVAVLFQLSQSHFRDYLRENFAQLQTVLRLSLFPLIARFDPEVHEHLFNCDMAPNFAISWIITWFSRDIRDTALVKRLFDFFLVSHPLMPLYVAAAMVTHPTNRREVLECECDFAELHSLLRKLPNNSVAWMFHPENEQQHERSAVNVPSVAKRQEEIVSNMEEIGGRDEADHSGHTEETETYDSSVSAGSQTSSSSILVPVPFQEIIELAIRYMSKIPPRQLTHLASKYYGKEVVKELLQISPDITMLKAPPAWSTASTAPSDATIRKRKRSRADIKAYDKTTQKYLRGHINSAAVVAAGFGPGSDAAKRRRRRQKLLTSGLVALLIFVVALWLGVQTGHLPSRSPIPKRPAAIHEKKERKHAKPEILKPPKPAPIVREKVQLTKTKPKLKPAPAQQRKSKTAVQEKVKRPAKTNITAWVNFPLDQLRKIANTTFTVATNIEEKVKPQMKTSFTALVNLPLDQLHKIVNATITIAANIEETVRPRMKTNFTAWVMNFPLDELRRIADTYFPVATNIEKHRGIFSTERPKTVTQQKHAAKALAAPTSSAQLGKMTTATTVVHPKQPITDRARKDLCLRNGTSVDGFSSPSSLATSLCLVSAYNKH